MVTVIPNLSAVSAEGSEMLKFSALPPLALYIHLPWCIKKCPYCDFNSHEIRQNAVGHGLPDATQQAYVDALLKDLENTLPLIWGRAIHSIFMGGGTPSLFSGQAIDRLLAGIRARVRLNAGAEITLEANPGAVEAKRFEAYARAGVNRISLGVQSFSDEKLKALGRIHGRREAIEAAQIAHEIVGNFNIDLMYALPGQTVAQASADITQALALQPTHLSAYQLTLEPNTLFHRYPPQLPNDDLALDIEQVVHETLLKAGFIQYEVSAFSKGEQYYCRHNLNYWQFGDYLGIGAGAHGKITLHDSVIRQVRFKQPTSYLQAVAKNAVQEEHKVVAEQLPFEFMLNTLRLNQGFDLRLFTERTSLPLTSLLLKLERAEQRGLIERDHRWVRPTALGRRFLNDLQQIFL
ncbi:MAG: radical SAM family heme chaperone HemW [Burkholderiaceae bacterium]|nr:radical SAM family heme chaperone HemW [Burkholderiaceae bacterium]